MGRPLPLRPFESPEGSLPGAEGAPLHPVSYTFLKYLLLVARVRDEKSFWVAASAFFPVPKISLQIFAVVLTLAAARSSRPSHHTEQLPTPRMPLLCPALGEQVMLRVDGSTLLLW